MSGLVKTGGADFSYYASPTVINQFEPVRAELVKVLSQELGSSDLPSSAKELATFTASLQQFQEDILGINSASQASFARLPAKLFKDISIQSPLFNILKAAYQYRQLNNWRKWDLTSPSRRDRYLDMLKFIYSDLESNHIYTSPKIYLSSSLPSATVHSLKDMVAKLKGK